MEKEIIRLNEAVAELRKELEFHKAYYFGAINELQQDMIRIKQKIRRDGLQQTLSTEAKHG